MRFSEMQRRERFDEILHQTLCLGWKEQYGEAFSISSSKSPSAQTWLRQPLLNAYFTPDIHRQTAHFLRDSLRYTPRKLRRVPQWIAASLLGVPAVLRAVAQLGFFLTPPLQHGPYLAIAPGNQRIRVFDFRTGLCRVMLKAGFAPHTMQNEIAFRTDPRTQRLAWIPKIHAAAEDGHWLEEAIIDGYALPRCPPSIDSRAKSKEAIEQLASWLKMSRTSQSAGERTSMLLGQLEKGFSALLERWGTKIPDTLRPWMAQLAAQAEALGSIEIAQSHGDFQPGNIIIHRYSSKVSIIDWEHSAPRYIHYDALVFSLSSRSGKGIAQRLISFRNGSHVDGLEHLPESRAWRKAAVALFLLEDLNWYVSECLTGPFFAPSQGLLQYIDELSSFGPRLENLFEEQSLT